MSIYQACSSTAMCSPNCRGAGLPSSLEPNGCLGEVDYVTITIFIIVWLLAIVGSLFGRLSSHGHYHQHHGHHLHHYIASGWAQLLLTINITIIVITTNKNGLLVTTFILFRNLGDCSLHPPDAIGGASELGQPNKSSLSALCGAIVESSLLLLFTVIIFDNLKTPPYLQFGHLYHYNCCDFTQSLTETRCDSVFLLLHIKTFFE